MHLGNDRCIMRCKLVHQPPKGSALCLPSLAAKMSISRSWAGQGREMVEPDGFLLKEMFQPTANDLTYFAE